MSGIKPEMIEKAMSKIETFPLEKTWLWVPQHGWVIKHGIPTEYYDMFLRDFNNGEKHITEEDFLTRLTFAVFWACYLLGITWAVVFLWRMI
jgi:hypothetical protein